MKKKLLAFLMGTALVFSLAACGGGDDDAADTGGDAGTDTGTETETAGVDAEAVYQKSCIACHGGDLTGGVGTDISKIGATMSADEIKTVIVEGKGTMPAQNVSDEEADALAQWLAAKK